MKRGFLVVTAVIGLSLAPVICAGVISPPPGLPAPDFSVTSVKLSPANVEIPCNVISCRGFVNATQFAVSLDFTASYVNFVFPSDVAQLSVLHATLYLLEDDLLDDDELGAFLVGSPFAISVSGINTTGTIVFSFPVGSRALNQLCLGGCETRIGALAELGELEFLIDTKRSHVNLAFTSELGGSLVGMASLDGTSLRLASEPRTLWLSGVGLMILFGLQGGRRAR